MNKIAFNQETDLEQGKVTQITPLVRRIIANNSGPLTYKGTNTYIVGQGEVAIIDPGPELDEHQDALIRSLQGEQITHILLTHTHRDHSDGIKSLQKKTGALTLGFGARQKPDIKNINTPTGKEFIDFDFCPDQTLKDRERVSGPSWELKAIHTPGHAPDHLCFYFKHEKILFCGDHVMAWNTSVIAPPEGHMGDYLRSLEKLLDLNIKTMLPGHGGRITTPRRVLKAYIVHRMMRESAIFQCLKEGHSTIPAIAGIVYADIDQSLLKSCHFSVLAHLEYLHEREKIGCSHAIPALESEYWPL